MAKQIKQEIEERKLCGVIMPLADIDGCSDSHWADVLQIITEAVSTVGFDCKMVSSSEPSGIIHKSILENLYNNPIVVCDVSAKNPNVMFELGMRLAFDKPTIVIIDDKTNFSFDTGPIDHLIYRRDLRFGDIISFKNKLAEKVKATYDESVKNPGYSTFLKQFGSFKVAKIDTEEVSKDEYMLEEIRQIKESLLRIGNKSNIIIEPSTDNPDFEIFPENANHYTFSLSLLRLDNKATFYSIVNSLKEIKGIIAIRHIGLKLYIRVESEHKEEIKKEISAIVLRYKIQFSLY